MARLDYVGITGADLDFRPVVVTHVHLPGRKHALMMDLTTLNRLRTPQVVAEMPD
jgi:hypothetical protein